MKNRFGFVSNSSSSSYVVINKEGSVEKIPESAFDDFGKLRIPNDEGWYSFGGDERWYGAILDRINFAFCQLLYLCEEEFPPKSESSGYDYYTMFNDALEQEGIKPNFILTAGQAKEVGQSIYGMSYDLFIDHQSSAVEGQNLEIFANQDVLHDFLFNFGSGIQGGYDG